MTLEERKQLKKELIQKIVIANGPSSVVFITTLLEEVKNEIIKKAMESEILI